MIDVGPHSILIIQRGGGLSFGTEKKQLRNIDIPASASSDVWQALGAAELFHEGGIEMGV